MPALTERRPAPMLPLLDRPFVQHTVEFLVGQGVREFDFVLSHLPEEIEGLLGDGTRWGAAIRCHLARDADHPYDSIRVMGLEAESRPVLLGHADRLPEVALARTAAPAENGTAVLFYTTTDETDEAVPAREWTGWAWLPGQVLADLSAGMDVQGLAHRMIGSDIAEACCVSVDAMLSVRTYADLIESQRRVFAKEFAPLLLTDRDVEEGLCVSRNVSLHPTVALAPPVFIGENCRIDAKSFLLFCRVCGRVLNSEPRSVWLGCVPALLWIVASWLPF